MRARGVLRAHCSTHRGGVKITTASGRELTTSYDHTHFAGYRVGRTPQKHITYLMWKRDKGYRVGTTSVHTDSTRNRSRIGLAQRCMQEGADAAWVISAHDDESEAR